MLQFFTFHDSMIWANVWCDWINWIINAVRIFYIRKKHIFPDELITAWISAPASLVLVSVIYTYMKCRCWPVTHIRGKKANGFQNWLDLKYNNITCSYLLKVHLRCHFHVYIYIYVRVCICPWLETLHISPYPGTNEAPLNCIGKSTGIWQQQSRAKRKPFVYLLR